MRIAFWLLACGVFFAIPSKLRAEDSPAELANKAKAILAKSCHRCHGENGTVEGGFGYVLDRQQLVSRKRVVPWDTSKSKLFRRVESGEMPPDGNALGKDDVAILKKWIDSGAADFNPVVESRKFISAEDVLVIMRGDIMKRDEPDRKFTRYLTLTHLFNAGRSEDELQGYRNAVAKLVNSLSWGRKVVVPTPIDPARTILRIDLRDYKWSGRIWDSISDADPYGLIYPNSANARVLYKEAGCSLPHVRGDWLVFAASRPPLYHEILQLPETDKDMESLLRVDVDDNIRSQQVARAGFNGSAVSRNNRLVERHESSYGYYWKSYDFGKNVGQQNLFAYPLGPGSAKNEFRHDGGELIFSLPNGLQGYMLTNAEGKRINKGPTEIVSDPKRPDRAVENGLSCMSCHVKGILPKDDQIRDHAEKNPASFSDKEIASIRAMYPPKHRFQSLVKDDSSRFRKAVEETGGQVGTTEPIVALAMLFEAELDRPLASAELNLEPSEFQKLLKRSPDLARNLGSLQTPGGTVQRELFATIYPDVVREWKLGTVASKTAAPGVGKNGAWIELGGKNRYPVIFQPQNQVISGKDGWTINEGRHYVKTKKSDYHTRDFTFELIYTLNKADEKGIVFVGFGEADRGAAYQEPKNSLYLAIHPPNVADGAIRLSNAPATTLMDLGKITKEGTHRLIIEKKGDVVTLAIDVDNDGESDDDIEKTFPDVKAVAPFLNKKNMHLFFGGGGKFTRIRITE
jgi:mono/diheme cytochrome c family protein